MPKPIFDEKMPKEEEVMYYERQNKKICPSCGLKFCTCYKNIFEMELPKTSQKKP